MEDSILSALYPLYRSFNKSLVAWAMNKYKRLKRHKTRAGKFIENLSVKSPNLFAHWRKETVGVFV